MFCSRTGSSNPFSVGVSGVEEPVQGVITFPFPAMFAREVSGFYRRGVIDDETGGDRTMTKKRTRMRSKKRRKRRNTENGDSIFEIEHL
jgi:hypothetical protein